MKEKVRLVSPGGETGEEKPVRSDARRGDSLAPDRAPSPGLAFDTYCSVAWALHFVAGQCRFLAADMARKIAADAAAEVPPLPPEPLGADAELAAMLAGLPDDLVASDPSQWIGLPVPERPCLLCMIVAHEAVPLTFVEALTRRVADHLGEALIDRYGLNLDHANYLAALARDEAVARAIERAPLRRIEAYLEDLSHRGMLGGERLVTYAHRGNSPLFVASVAECVGMESELVEAFLEDGGPMALERLLLRTDLVHALRVAVCNAYEQAIDGAATS